MTLLRIAIVGLTLLISLNTAPAARADGLCLRQTLAGTWVRPGARGGQISKIEVGYSCSSGRFTMRHATLEPRAERRTNDRHLPLTEGAAKEVWSTKATAQVLDGDASDPKRIGAEWTPSNCHSQRLGFEGIRYKFLHIFMTRTSRGLVVTARGRSCDDNKPFHRKYTFRR